MVGVYTFRDCWVLLKIADYGWLRGGIWMEQLFNEAPERLSDADARPLDSSARASLTALAQALDVFDPAAARRAGPRCAPTWLTESQLLQVLRSRIVSTR